MPEEKREERIIDSINLLHSDLRAGAITLEEYAAQVSATVGVKTTPETTKQPAAERLPEPELPAAEPEKVTEE